VTRYAPATRPTLYFIGVTTSKSSIMKVFPAWAEALGLDDAAIKGIDFPLHADPAAYREAVSFIKADRLSLGALVTTHKIDLFRACRNLFDETDPIITRTTPPLPRRQIERAGRSWQLSAEYTF